MSLIVDGNNTGNYEPAPAGTHLARCVQLIDLGTQHSPMFNKWAHKIRIGFELPTERRVFDQNKGEEPFLVSETFTVSFRENSNLRPFLESWRGRKFTKDELKQFDFKKLLGQPCLLAIGHEEKENGRTFAVITSISPLMKGQEMMAQHLPSIAYEIEDGKNAVFGALPEWIREAIEKCKEWSETKVTPNGNSPISDADVEAHRKAVEKMLAPAGATDTETPF